MARKGLNVLLLERGNAPGEKNMFGGMLPRCPVVEELLPRFRQEAPWERHVVKRTLCLLSEASATSFVFESKSFDRPPYSGYTLYRPVFDRWYAQQASEAGAKLVTGCLVEELLANGESVTGVRVGRDKGEIKSPITIVCDGVLSLLAQKPGLRKPPEPHALGLGIKALFRLKEEEINERFGLSRDQGCTQEFIGCTKGIRGGGFIYTQSRSLSAGLVLHLDSLKKGGIAPYDLFEQFLAYEPVRRLLKGARMAEYSAHMIPEGGYEAVPPLFSGGVLLAGDAAGLCYTNGLNLEGMNLAMASGYHAAETVLDAFQKAIFGEAARAVSTPAQGEFCIAGHEDLRKVSRPDAERPLFSVYPRLVGTIMGMSFKRMESRGRNSAGSAGRRQGGRAADGSRPDLLKGGRSLL
jgi:electron transfer flavoprotein-quinone oxidoreductase